MSKFYNALIKQHLWLSISILCSLYYGICFYYFVFNHQYIVQDDVRQHIVWLQRFTDPDLFPKDIIAEYFSSLAPLGFKSLYMGLTYLGIEPLLLAKILPPILAIATTIYCYFFTLEIISVPIAGFLSSLFLNQLMWLNDDLVSATHRAFIYPLFAGFLYYLARKSLIPCLILMLLQGLFYPHILLIEMVVLVWGLGELVIKIIKSINKKRAITFTSIRYLIFPFVYLSNLKINLKLAQRYQQAHIWLIAGTIITAIALYPITQKPPELATTLTWSEMRSMPEFNLGGRSVFFVPWWQYYFVGSSGLSLPLFPTIVWLGLALPWLLKTRLPLVPLITNKITILSWVIYASLIMFTVAHLILPTIHLPSRYTYHSLRFVLAISTGIVLTLLATWTKQWLSQQKTWNLAVKSKVIVATLMALTVLIFPAIPYVFTHWFQNWKIGTARPIYEYLAQQPKDILVASLSPEIDNIPAFAHRSILVGREFAIAYHPSYYDRIQQRTIDLLQAQYSLEPNALKSFIQKYDVDYFLLDRQAFTPEYLSTQDWLINSSWSQVTQQITEDLRSQDNFVMQRLLSTCSVVSTSELNLLASDCLASFPIPLEPSRQ